MENCTYASRQGLQVALSCWPLFRRSTSDNEPDKVMMAEGFGMILFYFLLSIRKDRAPRPSNESFSISSLEMTRNFTL